MEEGKDELSITVDGNDDGCSKFGDEKSIGRR